LKGNIIKRKGGPEKMGNLWGHRNGEERSDFVWVLIGVGDM
jgi:hypothetical protein